jgi:hypothetical protein
MAVVSLKNKVKSRSMLAGTPAFGFNPSSIAWMWYDAADTSTISVSGTAVTQWNNKGASGVNLTQGTAANRPTSGTTTLNGRNVISYDGGDVLLGTTPADWKFLHDGTNYLIGLVVKVTTSADPNADIHVFSNIRRAGADIAGRNLQAESRSTTVDRLRAYVANASATDYAVVQDSADNVWDQDNPVVYTELTDPDNATAADRIKSYFGTGSVIATNTKTNSVSSANPTYNMGIGATDDLAVGGITGYIAELIIVRGSSATEANRVIIRDYLKLKWGL